MAIDDLQNPSTLRARSGASHTRSPDATHFLVVTEGRGAGMCVELTDRPLAIGRRPGLGLLIDDPQVSGWHCTVSIVAGNVVVEDAGSTNGTYLNGVKIVGEAVMTVGSVLQLGEAVLLHEFRSRREVREQQTLSVEIRKAAEYVRSLLPSPREEGTLQARWCFSPSAQLGGDAFGYHALDDRRWAIYLLDVCGHGAGAALHSVSVLNVLRQQSLGATDFSDPAAVAAEVNSAFPMEDHGEMFFSLWYGVYDTGTRELRYCAGGHPPALLIRPDRSTEGLHSRHPPIGVLPQTRYESRSIEVPAGSWLYVFSDGVYEIVAKSGRDWSLRDFVSLLRKCPTAALGDPEGIRARVQAEKEGGAFQDDFSLLIFSFPA